MSYHSDHDPIGNTFREGTGAASHPCGAGELRHLLQHIAEHIANADVRQQAALSDMQTRLEHLADEAQSVRSVVPPEFAAAFERIEESISTLSQRIATSNPSRPIASGRENGSAPHDRGHEQSPPDFTSRRTYEEPAFHESSFGSEWTREAPPPLRSAAASPERRDWDRGSDRPLSPSAAAASSEGRNPDAQAGDWDRAAAEALTRLYEPPHAGSYSVVSQPPAQISDSDQFHFRSVSEDREYEDSLPELPRGNQSDRLEERFTEIAARIEQALANMRPDSSVLALEARFNSLESRMGSVLDGLPKRADFAKLQTVEAHIGELAQHVDRAQSQLARLDEIEFSLGRLLDHLSDDRMGQLFEQRLLADPNIAKVADAVASRLGEREFFQNEFGGADRFAELREVIEDFVASRRRGDEHMASALDTIQQAILNLLDRMEALEQISAQPKSVSDQEYSAGSHLRQSSLTSEYRFPGEDAGPSVFGKSPSVFSGAQRQALDVLDVSRGIDAEIEEARASAEKASSPAQLPMVAPVSTQANEGAGSEGRSEAAPLHANKEDFLAAARRAARKASSQAAEEQATSARPSFRQRPAVGERTPGARPITGLIVATLAVALAVGLGLTTYNIYKSGVVNPLSMHRTGITWGWSSEGSAGGAEGAAAGGVAGSESSGVSVGGADGEIGNSDGGSTPEVIIEDPPSSPGGVPAIQNGNERTSRVTGLGGIILDHGLDPDPEMVARAERQRALAQLSTRLGAAQASTGSIPAALIPEAQDGLQGTLENVKPSQSSKLMPPASIGPLSLRLAAANGDPSAEFEVAVRLAEGKGVQQNTKEAITWYQRSASRGFAPAQYRLGTLYERGLGVPADRGRAMAWYKSAAEKGNLKAMHNFAVLSASGDPADYRTAAHWFAEAAARGLADSQYNLAVLYETGRGVDRDLKLAYKWFALAARGGDKEAARRRDRAKALLDASQLKSAEALVRSWKALPTEEVVNDARAAGEAWKRRERQS